MADSAQWRPASGPDTARLRAELLDRARLYFDENDVLAVDTPALSTFAISDPNIESITVMSGLGQNSHNFLHTSPEYCMKRLLCAGYPDIYQMCKVFRDNEVGQFHQPEFTMIEWYRLNFSLDQIIDDALGFLGKVFDKDHLNLSATKLTYRDALQKYADCDPLNASVESLSAMVNADESLILSIGDNKDMWLDLILSQLVVPCFDTDELTVVSHYPISQAALARRCPKNDELADRFEIFLGTHELANGYVELTNAAEQRQRFNHDQTVRQSRDLPVRPLDESLLAAMQHGLPACAGVAIGFDRLLMIAAGKNDIRQVQTFAYQEPQ